jgi:hypothetical protein
MRNVSGKCCRENQNTHFVFKNVSQKLCHLQDNVEKCGRVSKTTDDNIIQCMHIPYCVTKAAVTYSEQVILIACPWQQCLCECVSVLCYINIACLVLIV